MADTPAEKTLHTVDPIPASVQVHAQYVRDFSFENPGAPHSLRVTTGNPEMDVNIVLDANKITDETNPDLYESAIKLTVKDIPAQHVKPILYVEVPQMLFPFARQIIANAVSGGGFPPLFLNPIDFRTMYMNSVRQGKEGAAA